MNTSSPTITVDPDGKLKSEMVAGNSIL